MGNVEAIVGNEADKYFLELRFADDIIRVPMSEDNPIKVKSAFNQLIERIRAGEFEIELNEVGDDLFSQVAKEYVTQLNREINEIRAEMGKFNLLAEQ